MEYQPDAVTITIDPNLNILEDTGITDVPGLVKGDNLLLAIPDQYKADLLQKVESAIMYLSREEIEIRSTKFSKLIISPAIKKQRINVQIIFRNGTRAKTRDPKVTNWQSIGPMSEFLKIFSHNLLTPLTISSWYAEMIKEQKHKLDNELLSYFTEIEQANSRLKSLAETFLAATKAETETALERNDDIELIHELTELLTALADRTDPKPTLNLKFSENIRMVSNRSALQRILNTLFDNSVRYSNPDSAVLITIKIKTTNENVDILIENNGPPISETDKTSIFKSFYRGAGASEMFPDGLGLGLFIARSLAVRLGGTLELAASDTKSTCFQLSLPI